MVWGEQTLEAKIEAARTRRFAELLSKQGVAALRSIITHKWAWPFKEPVDAEKLGLKDYHTIVTRPMVRASRRADGRAPRRLLPALHPCLWRCISMQTLEWHAAL